MAITKISNNAAKAAVDSLTALLNVGGAGQVNIYTGSMPTDVDTAVTTQTLLAEMTLSNPAFAAAIDNTGSAIATANTIAQDASANAAGTATWFRAFNGAGTPIIDGDVGTTTEAMVLNNINVALNDTIEITSWTIELAES